jgi:hypothetical protein
MAMKKVFLLTWIAAMLAHGLVQAATLQNTDSQGYDLQILETGRPFGSQYRIIENAQVEICFSGCVMTMVSTGQAVQVNPKDTVTIDSGVLSVSAGD